MKLPRYCRQECHPSARTAWHNLLREQDGRELSLTVSGHEKELLPRFTYFYDHLHLLPRRWRRGAQRRLRLPLAGIALALALGQQTALAATINVNGRTCTLIDAITAANTDTAAGGCRAGKGADKLVLPAGSITTLTAINNYDSDITPEFGPNGLPVITSKITIEGNGATIERSSAAGTPAFRILKVEADGDLSLKNAIISGGSVGTAFSGYGGSILNYRGTLTLSNTTITGNTATLFGGGIFSFEGSVTLIHSTVSGNTGRGGIGIRGSTLTLTNSTVSGNSGGGVNIHGGDYPHFSVVTLTNSTVSANTTLGFGGGINSYGGTVVLDHTNVSGNTARRGGGLDGENAIWTITNSTISGNTAESGGGVYIYSGLVALTNSTISGNSASNGGGIAQQYGGIALTNSTVTGNLAAFGGGLENYHGSVVLSNSTVVSNSALSIGGGISIFENGSLTLSRTIMSGNTAPVGAEIFGRQGYSVSTIIADNYNLLGDNSKTNATAFYGFTPGILDITATSNGTQPTTLNNILDTSLASNGGPTKTHALVAGSPAIDAIPADRGCLPADQRSVPRPLDGDGDGVALCDIGAVEFNGQITAIKIDFHPGNPKNNINPRKKGMATAAILGNGTLDVTVVDPDTIALGRDGAPTARYRYKDVNRDGYLDWLGWFSTADIGILCGDTEIVLTSASFFGEILEGQDSIATVGCN